MRAAGRWVDRYTVSLNPILPDAFEEELDVVVAMSLRLALGEEICIDSVQDDPNRPKDVGQSRMVFVFDGPPAKDSSKSFPVCLKRNNHVSLNPLDSS